MPHDSGMAAGSSSSSGPARPAADAAAAACAPDLLAWRTALLKAQLLLPGNYQGASLPSLPQLPQPRSSPTADRAGSPSRRTVSTTAAAAAKSLHSLGGPGFDGPRSPLQRSQSIEACLPLMRPSASGGSPLSPPSPSYHISPHPSHGGGIPGSPPHRMGLQGGSTLSRSASPSPCMSPNQRWPSGGGTAAGAGGAGGAGAGGGEEASSIGTPAGACGVSLRFLAALSDSLRRAHAPDDTNGIVQHFIAPLTRSFAPKGAGLWDLVAPQHQGPPQYYVIHARGAAFKAVVDQLLSLFAREDEDMVPSQVFVWVDIIALSQSHNPGSHTLDLTEVNGIIQRCGKGVVVAVDPELLVLSRLWCVYEMWAANKFGDHANFQLAFPDDISIDAMYQYEQACQRLDLSFCVTSRPEDRMQIMHSIKHSVGVKLMTRTLSEALIRSSRAALRFSRNMCDVSLYCALLLKGGEYSRCQQVLNLIDELEDDEKMLEDVRNIFQMYDTEGRGELFMDDFIEVLKKTGFEDSEAAAMYDDVDVDSGGSVSMQEFEDWFRATQRQQAGGRARRRVMLTTEGLIENLEKMVKLMHRAELSEYESFFSDVLTRLRTGQVLKPGAPLQVSPLKGDWQTLTDEVMWSLHLKEWRPAASKLYDLLMWNSDSLDYHPLQIPPYKADAKAAAMKTSLLLYMQLFSSILMHQPGRKMHADYINSCVEELSKETGAPNGRRGMAPAATKQSVQYEKSRFQIVRSMISLKYGSGQPVSRPLIFEAEVSIGQWMAGNKHESKHKSKRRSNGMDHRAVLGGVGDLATQYLSSVGVKTLMPSGPAVEKLPKGSVEVNMNTVLLKREANAVSSSSAYDAAPEEQGDGLPDLTEVHAVGGGGAFVVNRIGSMRKDRNAPSRLDDAGGGGNGGGDGDTLQRCGSGGLGSRAASRAGTAAETSSSGGAAGAGLMQQLPVVAGGVGGLEVAAVGGTTGSASAPASPGGAQAAGGGDAAAGPGRGVGTDAAGASVGGGGGNRTSVDLSTGGAGAAAAAAGGMKLPSLTGAFSGPPKSLVSRSPVVDELLAKIMPSSATSSSYARRHPEGHGSALGSLLMSTAWDPDGSSILGGIGRRRGLLGQASCPALGDAKAQGREKKSGSRYG